MTEAAKLAFADREAWYGDPAFTDVPLDDLLSAAYNDERRELIGDAASADLRPGRPGGREPSCRASPRARSNDRIWRRRRAAARGSGDPGIDPATGEPLGRAARRSPAGRGDTCHLDVADRWGNVVSRDAERRLAAVLAGHPVARLLPRHPGADVHARPRACPRRSRRASGRGPR